MGDPMNPQTVQAYKDACDNLIYLKKEQFQVTYYTWLLLAALFVLARAVKPEDKILLQGGVVLVAVASVATLLTFQGAIVRFRERLQHIYEIYFEPDERDGLGFNASETHHRIVGFLIFACLVACAFTWWVM